MTHILANERKGKNKIVTAVRKLDATAVWFAGVSYHKIVKWQHNPGGRTVVEYTAIWATTWTCLFSLEKRNVLQAIRNEVGLSAYPPESWLTLNSLSPLVFVGGFFSTIFSSLFGTREMRILILGLDGAGKTTILYRLQVGEVVTTIPSKWSAHRENICL